MPTPPTQSFQEFPPSVQSAAELADLISFLEDVPVGFHWDILDRLEDGVYLLDQARRIRYWSKGAEQITGFSAREVLGRCCSDNILMHANDAGERLCKVACPIARVMTTAQSVSAELYLHHKAGHRVPVRVYGAPLHNADGELIGAFETFSETTALLGSLERVRQLEEIAYLDPLTNLANRRYLNHEIDRRLQELQSEQWLFGVVMADVDHFKHFNDTHGHEVGDRVLRMVSQTLANHCRSHDLVGRWGGEEFLIIVSLRNEDELWRFAEKARGLVAISTLDVKDESVQVTISAGASVAYPGDTAESLVKRADRMMYESKSAGRNRVRVFKAAEAG